MLKKSFIASIIVLTILSVTTPVLAQYGLEETGKAANLPEGVRSGNLPSLIGSFINIALGIIGVIFLCLMVYAGFLWMTAMGDPKKTSTAKDLIFAAIIGIIIIVLAYAISYFVISSLSDISSSPESGLKEMPDELLD